MEEKRNWSTTGEQIKSALSEAVQSGDYKNLNDLISQTVTDAVSEVGKHISFSTNTAQQNRPNPSARSASTSASDGSGPEPIPIWQQRAQEREWKKQQQKQQEWQAMQQRKQEQSRRKSLPAIKIKKVGTVSNVLLQVYGGIGLGITGLVTFFRFLVLFTGDTTVAGWILNLLFLLGFYGMIRVGVGQKKRLKRAERYLQLCDYRVYGEIETLARGTGQSESQVVRDLEKMLRLGIFPEGHLDKQKTCFMLNDEVYRQYQETEKNRRIRELEEKKALEDRNASHAAQPSPEATQAADSELHSMVAEGMEYVRKLRDLNDRIPGEVISAKLFSLENLLKDIFESVKQHPEQMDRMHKLMSYYLPTTLKLVQSYETFDKVSSPGSDIIKAKAEIENTLDTINQAFRELLNNLFQDKVLDATTDAQVLKTMLAKEGLTRDMDFAGFTGKE